MSPPPEKVGGHDPRVPHQTAPMMQSKDLCVGGAGIGMDLA